MILRHERTEGRTRSPHSSYCLLRRECHVTDCLDCT